MKRVLRIGLILIIVLLSFLFWQTGHFSAVKKAPSKAPASIRVVLDDNYPPYIFRDKEGNMIGLLVDQWKLWERKTGIPVKLQAMDWGKALQKAEAGECDVIDTIFYTEERAKHVDFSAPYADIEVPVFYAAKLPGIHGIHSLSGFPIAVKRGDAVGQVLRARGITNIIEYDNYEAIIRAVLKKEVVVFSMDAPPADYFLYNYGLQDQFKQTSPLYTGQFHRAVRKGDSQVLALVEGGFSQISETEYHRIQDKWLSYGGVNPERIQTMIVSGVVLVVIVLGLFIWNWALNRSVRQKTSELTGILRKLRASEARQRALLTQLATGVVVYSPGGEITYYNPETARMLGVPVEGTPERADIEDAIKRFVRSDGTPMPADEMTSHIASRTKLPVQDQTMGIVKGPGEIIWTKVDAIPQLDEEDQLREVIVTLADITARKNAEEALKASSNRLNAILTALPDTVLVFNRQGILLDYHIAGQRLDQLTPSRIGKSVFDLVSPEAALKMKQKMAEIFQTGQQQIQEYALTIQGETRYFEDRLVCSGDDQVVAIIRDMTDKKQAELRIVEMSIRDEATGLYNRNYFERQMNTLQGTRDARIGIVICDIDGLKLINDTLGHGIGDEYLNTVAEVLVNCFRARDTVARIGGDEFAVLMPDVTEAEIQQIQQRVYGTLDRMNVGERLIPLSISIGYSVTRGELADVQHAYQEADDLMYREKYQNRQRARSKNIKLLLTRLLETRDYITEGHGDRMQDWSRRLAEKIGMTGSEADQMSLLAQFHDVGKVGIPDTVLFKPGKLTPDEWALMKRHPEIGYRIAEASSDLHEIADYIYKHHEWWNGSGYPFGLHGEEIPLQSRILTVIDAYDAMTSSRPYRKPMTHAEAVAELRRCSGTQFDPGLVEQFIALLETEMADDPDNIVKN
ncbi:MAG: diguanylate cyclase domain-containing protein [Solirubrobacterales bacterium]